MSRITNQAIFSKNANDDSAITEVTVVRVSNGDIGLRLKVSDSDNNKKVFDTLESLYSGAKHGAIPATQDHFCLFDSKRIEVVASVLLKLKEKQLLSQALFTDVCANFPADIEHKIDQHLAGIVGVVPSQVANDPSQAVREKYLGSKYLTYLSDSPTSAELLALQQRITLAPQLDMPVVSKPESIDCLFEMGLGKRAQAHALLSELRQSPECEGFDLDRIWTPEFREELDAQFAHLDSETNSKHRK